MNRKIKFGIFALLFVLIAIILVNNPMKASNKSNNEYSIASGEAKILNFDNISNLEQYSDYIVIGHVMGEQTIYNVKTDKGIVVDQLGQTPFYIDRVIKGDLSNSTTITVSEDGYIKGKNYNTLEGYVKMKKNAQFLLFLRKTGDNTYAINGSYQGKYNINNKEKAQAFTSNTITDEQLAQYDYIGEDTEHYNKLKDEVLSKYVE